MTFLYTRTNTWTSAPQPNEETIKLWNHITKKSNWRISSLYRKAFLLLLENLGYFKRYIENNYLLVQCTNNVLQEVEISIIKDRVNSLFSHFYKGGISFPYNDETITVSVEDLEETYLKQSHLIFNNTFLENLSNFYKPILRDVKLIAYLPFKNGLVTVTRGKITFSDYSQLENKCVWKEQIIDRNFDDTERDENCHFYRFLCNVCNSEEDRLYAFITAIGYLLHNYSDPSKGQAIICYDEDITDLDAPQGGTGKGVFAQAIKQIRNTIKIDGKKFDEKNRFCFQRITQSTQVVWFDDVKATLGFDRFNSILTDGWDIEKKYAQQDFFW